MFLNGILRILFGTCLYFKVYYRFKQLPKLVAVFAVTIFAVDTWTGLTTPDLEVIRTNSTSGVFVEAFIETLLNGMAVSSGKIAWADIFDL